LLARGRGADAVALLAGLAFAGRLALARLAAGRRTFFFSGVVITRVSYLGLGKDCTTPA
jgi:hypothetical protein